MDVEEPVGRGEGSDGRRRCQVGSESSNGSSGEEEREQAMEEEADDAVAAEIESDGWQQQLWPHRQQQSSGSQNHHSHLVLHRRAAPWATVGPRSQKPELGSRRSPLPPCLAAQL